MGTLVPRWGEARRGPQASLPGPGSTGKGSSRVTPLVFMEPSTAADREAQRERLTRKYSGVYYLPMIREASRT